jgi:Tol biopolymer transport system component
MNVQLHNVRKLVIGFAMTALLLAVPVVLAAQEKIVFSSNREGVSNQEIYVMNTDGSDQKRLTFNTVFDGEASFSADGGKIVFTSTRDGNAEIYVMNADGSKQKRLTNSLGSDAHPSFSPDGTKIAFISDREGGLEIFTMNSDGTNATRLTNPPFSKFNPSFNADGTQILFSAIDGNDSEIWLMNADGSNPVNLTDNTADDRTARFNAAGTRIVYMSDVDDPQNHDFDIMIMNADGSNPVNLTRNIVPDSDPSFSPDGGTVVFISNRSGDAEIWAMTAGGTGAINLSNNGAAEFRPSWGTANSVPELSNVTISSPINEGDTATLAGEIVDGNAGDGITFTVDWGDGHSETFEKSVGPFALTHTYVDDQPAGSPTEEYSVTYSANDHRFGVANGSQLVKVNNANPIVSDLAVTPAPVTLGNEITLSANYTDPGYHGSGSDEQLNVIVIWGDGQNQTVTTTGAPGSISETHKYAAAGAYTAKVQVTDNDGGFTLATIDVVVAPPPAPAAPTDLRVDFIAANRIQIVWKDNSSNEDGFAIERCAQRGCNNFVEVGRVFPGIQHFVDGNLLSNTQYYYRVRGFNAGGMSAYTDVVSAKTLKK